MVQESFMIIGIHNQTCAKRARYWGRADPLYIHGNFC